MQRVPTAVVNGMAPVVETDGKAEPLYTYRYTVRGNGMFPTDMLRYDRSWPQDTGDAAKILGTGVRNVREVVLISTSPRRHWEPTYDRWRSFGWIVVHDEVA